MKRGLSIALLVLVAMGCASAPERRPPDISVAAPPNWDIGEAPTSDVVSTSATWWYEFGDDHLNSLVHEALNNNLDIKLAVARVDQAAALARIAGAEGIPQLSAGFRASRQKQNIIGISIPGAPSIITSRTNSFGVSLDTSWEVDLWGRIRKGQSAALADVEGTQAELAAIRLSIAGQTAKAWIGLIEAKEQLRLAEETVDSYSTSAQQVRTRYGAGMVSSLDFRLALASLAGAEALLEFRKQQLDQTIRQTEILLGRYPAGELDVAVRLPVVADGLPEALPSELLIRRPDLFAAERRFAAAEARVSEARRAFFPSIQLTASGGTLSDQLKDLTNGDFGVWNIAAGVVQPLFQGGRLRANLSQSHAVADQALAIYAMALLQAFGEVETAIVAENLLGKQELHLSVASEQSEAARLLAERQYDAGLVDYITVLETQRRSLTAQSELIAVRRLRLDARVNLHLSLGGGFDLEEGWADFLEPPGQSEGGDSVE